MPTEKADVRRAFGGWGVRFSLAQIWGQIFGFVQLLGTRLRKSPIVQEKLRRLSGRFKIIVSCMITFFKIAGY